MKKTICLLLSLIMLICCFSECLVVNAADPVTFSNYSVLETGSDYVKVSCKINNPNKNKISGIRIIVRRKNDSTTAKSYLKNVEYTNGVNVTRTIGSGKNISYELQAGVEYEVKFGVVINGNNYLSSFYSFRTEAVNSGLVKFYDYDVVEKGSGYVKVNYKIGNPNKKTISAIRTIIREKGDNTTLKSYKYEVEYTGNVNVSKTIGSGKDINYELKRKTEYEIKFGVIIDGESYFSQFYSFNIEPFSSTVKEIIYHGDSKLYVEDVIGSSNNFCDYVKSLNSSSYNPKLSYMLAGLARSAYNKDNIELSVKTLGFGYDYIVKKYDGNKFNAAHTIAKQTLSDGTTIVLVVVRGSSQYKNWIADFNVVTTNPASGNHAGFDIAANEVLSNMKNFLGGINKSNVKYVITGHSYGAAVGNLLSMKLSNAGVSKSDVYNYNFACPDVARGNSLYWNPNGIHDNIFNIGYAKDYISVLPGITLNLGNTNAWGKYGKSYWFSKDWSKASETYIDLTQIKKNHDCKNYVDYLSKYKSLSSFKTWKEMTAQRTWSICKSIIHGIFCPVDVDVYDSDGILVASIKNNEIVKCDDESGEVLAFVDDDHKYICVPADKNYDIRLTGNDEGTMTYTAIKADLAEQTIEEQKTFDNVALTKGKTMETVSFADSDTEDTKLYVVDENKNAVSEVDTQGKETSKKSITKVSVSGITDKTYTGELITQNIMVKYDGTTLTEGEDYTVSYINNCSVGTAVIFIKGQGDYAGVLRKYFQINADLSLDIPKPEWNYSTIYSDDVLYASWEWIADYYGYQLERKVSGEWVAFDSGTTSSCHSFSMHVDSGTAYKFRVRLFVDSNGIKKYGEWSYFTKVTKPDKPIIKAPSTNKKHRIIVKWKKVSRCSGYQVQFSRKKSFSSVFKSKTISKKSTTSYTGKGFKKGKKYYIRIRSYRTVDGKKYYSPWSSIKSIKCK